MKLYLYNRDGGAFLTFGVVVCVYVCVWGGGGVILTPRGDVLEPAMLVSQSSWDVCGSPRVVWKFIRTPLQWIVFVLQTLHCTH